MKQSILTLGGLFLLSLTGCVATSGGVGVDGMLYTKNKVAVTATSAGGEKTLKQGTACTEGVLGVAWGDSSVETAKHNGSINKVHSVDAENTLVLFGVYAKSCTIVTGE
jgi:tryptophan synthase beta subunit